VVRKKKPSVPFVRQKNRLVVPVTRSGSGFLPLSVPTRLLIPISSQLSVVFLPCSDPRGSLLLIRWRHGGSLAPWPILVSRRPLPISRTRLHPPHDHPGIYRTIIRESITARRSLWDPATVARLHRHDSASLGPYMDRSGPGGAEPQPAVDPFFTAPPNPASADRVVAEDYGHSLHAPMQQAGAEPIQ
jgi:hypothetical protein